MDIIKVASINASKHLSRLYVDSASILRNTEYKDDSSPIIRNKRIAIGEPFKCYLSTNSLNADKAIPQIINSYSATLFCEKDINIENGDMLAITKDSTQKVYRFLVESVRIAFYSHQEIKLVAADYYES